MNLTNVFCLSLPGPGSGFTINNNIWKKNDGKSQKPDS